MQATVFGYNIKIFESSLKLYHTYSITNPTVSPTPEMFHFLKNKNQLGINARTPVEEIEIDGLTMRTMKYNFTPITSLQQIKEANPRLDVLFVILNVGPRKFINNSYVVDVRITDQSLQPSILSLWDQFSEYEAHGMANLPGSFPVAIGLRLKTSKYYGRTLATRNSSSFIFDAVLPEATALQSWAIANTVKLRALAATEPEHILIPKGPEDPEDDTIKIANLPISVDKTQYLNVQGIARVTDFSQNFYYLACSICKKATNAYGNGDFWCNYCAQKVPALTKLKFNIHITDPTGTIEATVFSEVASEFYNITAADTIDGQLALSVLHMLAEPKKCIITLKASMHSYAGINQLKFTVHSISVDNNTEMTNRSEALLALPPNTPNKRSKKGDNDSSTSTSSPTIDTTAETNLAKSSLSTEETPASPSKKK
ncbi:replication protein A 70 kDa DNA-binding subunit B-like [Rhododendron vialii]|uniref:replication protein A 70 kDa DNA-binding subunit B-like n=1 Tax=Rhododendron vialii TaxID=182163 RepID=UPI0026603A8C|nr:replication protein A 70 kDa DNA-binding subunit B-like [Rhododendron vialii]